MKTLKVFSLIDGIIEKEILELKEKINSPKTNDKFVIDLWKDDLREIALLRKKIDTHKGKYLDRVLPF